MNRLLLLALSKMFRDAGFPARACKDNVKIGHRDGPVVRVFEIGLLEIHWLTKRRPKTGYCYMLRVGAWVRVYHDRIDFADPTSLDTLMAKVRLYLQNGNPEARRALIASSKRHTECYL